MISLIYRLKKKTNEQNRRQTNKQTKTPGSLNTERKLMIARGKVCVGEMGAIDKMD